MNWQFQQSTGNIYDPDGHLVATGYAGGNLGLHPEGKNNPAMQQLHLIGPLPRGLYTMGTPVAQSRLGPFAIPLIPDPANEMFGRGDFYIHGDRIGAPGCASDGCIIMPRQVRNLIWASSVHTLEVVE